MAQRECPPLGNLRLSDQKQEQDHVVPGTLPASDPQRRTGCGTSAGQNKLTVVSRRFNFAYIARTPYRLLSGDILNSANFVSLRYFWSTLGSGTSSLSESSKVAVASVAMLRAGGTLGAPLP